MFLDTRQPVFVFRGVWNPAIFQPSWLAKNLFNIEAGKEVPAFEMNILTPVPIKITYFDNIGIAANNEIVRIFINGNDEKTIKEAEAIAFRLLETLPHTPLAAIGVNYTFVEDEPNDKLLGCLHTNDSIHKYFKILAQELTTSIEIDSAVLNFSRQPTDHDVKFNFNYHHDRNDFGTKEKLINGACEKYLKKSTEILEKLYSLKEYNIKKHEFTKNPA